jgi:hypothetical protein
VDADGDLVELVLWRVGRSTTNPEGIRYRLVFVPAGGRVPIVLYDNHHPKGHHRHRNQVEESYPFTTVTRLLRDFLKDVRRAKKGSRREGVR